jgi:hypothetical protein
MQPHAERKNNREFFRGYRNVQHDGIRGLGISFSSKPRPIATPPRPWTGAPSGAATLSQRRKPTPRSRPRISNLWTDARVYDLLRLAADAPRRTRHARPFPRLRRGSHLPRPGPTRETIPARCGRCSTRVRVVKTRRLAQPVGYRALATACSLAGRQLRTLEFEQETGYSPRRLMSGAQPSGRIPLDNPRGYI